MIRDLYSDRKTSGIGARALALCLSLLTLCAAFAPLTARADAASEGGQYAYGGLPTPNVLLIDADDGAVLFEKNADQRAYPASTTKIMTCMLALEYGDPDASVTVGNEVLGTKRKFTAYSSLMGLAPGETVTLRDLLYGIMMVSGNDAAEAIAVYIGGSIDGFADLMNRKAASLGMTGTHYTNPHGVQDENHYTTARDIGRLTRYALGSSEFRKIVASESYTVPASNLRSEPMELLNSNRLIRMPSTDTTSCVYPYAIGVKTGDTDAAGKCLVAAAEKDGATLIAVLLGDKASMYGDDTVYANLARFLNARDMFEDVFNNVYARRDASGLALPADFSLACLNASPADAPDGAAAVRADLSGLFLYGSPSKLDRVASRIGEIEARPAAYGELSAPLTAGACVGTVDYVLDGSVLFSAPLYISRDVGYAASATVTEPAGTGDAPLSFTPAEEPLVKKNFFGRFGFLAWMFIILLVLLLALIVIFVLTEKKRQRERARRRRAHRAEGTGNARYHEIHKNMR